MLVGLALLPGIPIVVGLAISVQHAAAGAAATTTEGFAPVGQTASTPAPKHAGPALPAIPGGSGSLIALVRHPTALRSSPDGRTIAQLGTKTQFGSPEVLWVVKHKPGWLGVITPQAGNGRVAWILQSMTSLTRVSWELEVSLSARRLTVLNQGKVVERYTVAIGTPGAPTPTGRFAVTDRLATDDPGGPYGCCILALSANAPHAIQGWTGGTRIAIHSTPETGTIGEAASHGCIRLTLAEGRWLLGHIPLGTPTLISA
jgi:lipoprotein-anchoring transpeptidase ErfK/SrfK